MSLVTPPVRPPEKSAPARRAPGGASDRSAVVRAIVVLIFLIALGLYSAQVVQRFSAVGPNLNPPAVLPLPA
jgi:hypothetical protein